MNIITSDMAPPIVTQPKAPYKVFCSECKTEFPIKLSVGMREGRNMGFATCKNCKVYLHIWIAEDGSFLSELHFVFVARLDAPEPVAPHPVQTAN